MENESDWLKKAANQKFIPIKQKINLRLHWFSELCLSTLAAGFRLSSTKFDLSCLLMIALTILLHPHF